MKFKKNRCISETGSFSETLIISPFVLEVHVLSIPFFGQDCKAADDIIAKKKWLKKIRASHLFRLPYDSARSSIIDGTATEIKWPATWIGPFLDVRSLTTKRVRNHRVFTQRLLTITADPANSTGLPKPNVPASGSASEVLITAKRSHR